MSEERQLKFVTIKVPLDVAHEVMVNELEEVGVDVEDMLAKMCISNVEQNLYQLYQSVKYESQQS